MITIQSCFPAFHIFQTFTLCFKELFTTNKNFSQRLDERIELISHVKTTEGVALWLVEQNLSEEPSLELIFRHIIKVIHKNNNDNGVREVHTVVVETILGHLTKIEPL